MLDCWSREFIFSCLDAKPILYRLVSSCCEPVALEIELVEQGPFRMYLYSMQRWTMRWLLTVTVSMILLTLMYPNTYYVFTRLQYMVKTYHNYY